MLEAGLYADNSFLTLTYAKDPVSLHPPDHRRFMDALRKRLKPLTVRFYMVGEYGDRQQRPHFHYVLFGYPSCKRQSSLRRSSKHSFRCCSACDLVEDVWGKGHIKNLPLEIGSARYVARYVIKKMTRHDDPRLGNRHPEFARMSLRPGIGSGALESVAATITRYNLLDSAGDVPVTLRHGATEYPLGRYLRKQLRKALGLNEKSPHTLSAKASYAHFHSPENQALRSLQEAARLDPKNPSLKAQLLKASEGQRLQIQRRLSMLNKKGSI